MLRRTYGYDLASDFGKAHTLKVLVHHPQPARNHIYSDVPKKKRAQRKRKTVRMNANWVGHMTFNEKEQRDEWIIG